MAYDALSDVLRAVRLQSAVFFDVEATAPWVAESPSGSVLAPYVMPGAEHVIQFHVATRGECWATLLPDSDTKLLLCESDVVAFPQGDSHAMSSSPGMRAQPDLNVFQRPSDPGALPIMVNFEGEAGQPDGHLICGFFGCDATPFNPLLEALPRMIHMRGSEGSGWIGRLAEFAQLEAKDRRAGSASVLTKLGELMFIDMVRHYLGGLSSGSAGWLSALGDKHVGRVISLIHEAPAENWSLASLAREAGLSRSSLAERFQRFVGKPPMQYLALWRMQVASSMLAGGEPSIARVASKVGYESEAAFSRAFKRTVGHSPSEWRVRRAAARWENRSGGGDGIRTHDAGFPA